jgi:hypothetical protein
LRSDRIVRENRASICGSVMARPQRRSNVGRRDPVQQDARFTIANHPAAIPRRNDRQAPSQRLDLRHAETVECDGNTSRSHAR